MLPEIGSDTDEPVSPCIPSPTLLLPVGRFVPDHPNDPDAPPLSPLPAESVKSEDETEDLPIGRFYGFHPCYYTRCMVSFDGSLKDLNSAFGGILQVFQSSLYRIRPPRPHRVLDYCSWTQWLWRRCTDDCVAYR